MRVLIFFKSLLSARWILNLKSQKCCNMPLRVWLSSVCLSNKIWNLTQVTWDLESWRPDLETTAQNYEMKKHKALQPNGRSTADWSESLSSHSLYFQSHSYPSIYSLLSLITPLEEMLSMACALGHFFLYQILSLLSGIEMFLTFINFLTFAPLQRHPSLTANPRDIPISLTPPTHCNTPTGHPLPE